jgi:hypothetical protein
MGDGLDDATFNNIAQHEIALHEYLVITRGGRIMKREDLVSAMPTWHLLCYDYYLAQVLPVETPLNEMKTVDLHILLHTIIYKRKKYLGGSFVIFVSYLDLWCKVISDMIDYREWKKTIKPILYHGLPQPIYEEVIDEL